MELIRLNDISKTYYLGEVQVPVLRGVSLTINRGEMVALMGASGSGKTTLMNILGCLDHPTSGQYWLDGQEMSGLAPNQRALVRAEKIGFVFQSFNLLARTTAIQNVVMPLDYSPQRCSSAEARRVARTLLDHVGLADRAQHEPSQMSGGQQQRVAIGRALINRPTLVLADEPTGNLDSVTSVEILRMFQQLNAEGITVVLVTHDPQVAVYAHRVIRIVDGTVASDDSRPPDEASPTNRPRSIRRSIRRSSEDRRIHPRSAGDSGRSAVAGPARRRAARRWQPRRQTQRPTRRQARSGGDGGPARAVGGRGRSRRVGRGGGRGAGTAAADRLAAAGRLAGFYGDAAAKPRRSFSPTLIPATWRTALGALRRHKMRSGLSALGVIIAVAAVIAMTEIGQGSKAMLQRDVANMGANMIMVFSGATNTGGVSSGTGSAMTLTPEDAIEMARQCPAVAQVAPTVRARVQIVYKNRNWVPDQVTGTTPAFLAVRDWSQLAAGEMFTDRNVRNGNKVCVIGNTVKRNLFPGVSPVGKEIRVNNVAFRVVGVLSRKGANMVGMDQDNVVLAPWTTVKYRVSGSTMTNVNQSASSAGNSSGVSDSVNTLDNLYATGTARYLSRSTVQAADYPQPVRFANVDQILVKGVSSEKVKPAIEQMTALLRERHRIRAGADDDFTIRDMAEMIEHALLDDRENQPPAAGRGHDLAGRRRRGDHEHHARLGHRADAGDRAPHGRRGAEPPRPAAISRRGGGLVSRRRRDRDPLRPRRLDPRPLEGPLANRGIAGDDPHHRRRLRRRRHRLRLLPRLESLAARPDRSPAV